MVCCELLWFFFDIICFEVVSSINIFYCYLISTEYLTLYIQQKHEHVFTIPIIPPPNMTQLIEIPPRVRQGPT